MTGMIFSSVNIIAYQWKNAFQGIRIILMKKIFLFLFLTAVIQNIYTLEFIQFLESWEFDEDEYELSFNPQPGYTEKGGWTVFEEADSSDFAENDSFFIRLKIPDFTLIGEDNSYKIENPMLVLQLHGHWFETDLNGVKHYSDKNDINKFKYSFIPLTGYESGDTVLIRSNTSIYGSFTIYITDTEIHRKNPGKFALYPFINEGLDFVVSLSIMVIGLLGIIFYFISRNRNYIYILLFSLFSILLSVFHLLSTDIIPTFIPVIPLLKETIEMIAFDSLSLLILLLYIAVFEKSWLTIFKILISGNIIIIILNFICNIAGILLPLREVISFVYPGIEYLIIWLHMSIEIKNIYPSKYFRLAFITLAVTYLSQLEFVFGAFVTDIVFNTGLLLFYSFIALVPVTSYLRQDKRIKDQNIIFRKFVPEEFLKFLSKEDITQIKLGDQIEKKITVLFSDIRSFTAISEKMEPQEIFNYLNSYLNQIGPVIRKHNGFIDKYIGDAIMALFPDNPGNAVEAAIEIQETIIIHNEKHKNFPEIKAGIGIHTGKTMLGIIGENERIESTVISDTVNTASRLEHLTKEYNKPVLFSEDVAEALSDNYPTENLGSVQIRGKKNQLNIFSLKTE